MPVSGVSKTPNSHSSHGPESEDPSKVMQDMVKQFYDKLKEPDEDEEPDEGDPD